MIKNKIKKYNVIIALIVSFLIMLIIMTTAIIYFKIALKEIFIQGEFIVGMLVLVPTIIGMIVDKIKSDNKDIYDQIKLVNEQLNQLYYDLEKCNDEIIIEKSNCNNATNNYKQRINRILIKLSNITDIYNNLYEEADKLPQENSLSLKYHFNYNLIDIILDQCLNDLYTLNQIDFYEEARDLSIINTLDNEYATYSSLFNALEKSYKIRGEDIENKLTISIQNNFYNNQIIIDKIIKNDTNIQILNKIFYKCKFKSNTDINLEQFKKYNFSNLVFIECDFSNVLVFKEFISNKSKVRFIDNEENKDTNNDYNISENDSTNIEASKISIEQFVELFSSISGKRLNKIYKYIRSKDKATTKKKKSEFLKVLKDTAFPNIDWYFSWSRAYQVIHIPEEMSDMFKWSGWHSFLIDRIDSFTYFVFAEDIANEKTGITERIDFFIFEKEKLRELFIKKNISSDGKFYDFYFSKNEMTTINEIKAYDFKDYVDITDYCEVVSIDITL